MKVQNATNTYEKEKRERKLCPKGHVFYKGSDCLTCPTCEEEKKPTSGFLSEFSAPARRALESLGIKNVEDLSRFSEKEIMALHGMGPKSLPTLNKELGKKKLTFKK